MQIFKKAHLQMPSDMAFSNRVSLLESIMDELIEDGSDVSCEQADDDFTITNDVLDGRVIGILVEHKFLTPEQVEVLKKENVMELTFYK
jgi:hypothetical protein